MHPILIFLIIIVSPFILYFLIRVIVKAVLDSIDIHFNNKFSNHLKSKQNVNKED